MEISDTLILVLLIGFLLLFIYSAFNALLTYFKSIRRIEDIPRSKIASAAQGLVELHGKIKPFITYDLVTPISNEKCCWYQYEVFTTDKKRRKRIHTSGKSEPYVIISDETGDCLLEMSEVNICIVKQKEFSILKSKLPEKIKDQLSDKLFLGFTPIVKVQESFLSINDNVIAMGRFYTNGVIGKQMNLSKESREITRAWFVDRESLLEKWDSNKDGKLDSNELENISRQVWYAAVEKFSKNKDDYTIHILGGTNDNDVPFIVSVGNEIDVTSKLRKSIMHNFIGLITMTAFLIYLISSI